MPIVEIQGIKCNYREKREDEEVLFSQYEQSEQCFRREEHPFTDDELINIANREHTYTALQAAWKEREEKRFEDGVYLSIDGEEKFVPGAYWCYINYWTLEHGEKPDYREDDREFFLYHEYLRLETECLATTRLKGRRQGATSIGMFFQWFIAGRKEHKLCGSTSFTDTAAQDNFQRMFMYGFKAMLPCFQADFDSDAENFIRFVKPLDKKKKGVLAVKREGLNSYVDFKSNAINSYDSGRQSYNVPDEAAKRGTKVNINSYWSRLSKTLVIGSNKVGFAYFPTTVGQKKEGGENYRLFFNNSNQYAIDKETGEAVGINTPTRCVYYFMPATRCYAGCIDKFGRSVIEDPLVPILSNEGKWITEGSRTQILRERSRLEGEQLMEHRRDYPLDIFDAFAFENGLCEFNEKNFMEQIRFLEENPDKGYWRQCRLYEKIDAKGRLTVDFMDDPKGDWWIWEIPDKPNNYEISGSYIEAKSKLLYQAGADTYRNIFAENGSEGVLCFTKKSCIIEGVETGLYPVAIFVGRPKLIKQFNRQAFLGCIWYGCTINFEIDAGTWFYEDFTEWNAQRLLEWTPAIDPTKRGTTQIKPGTESASPYQLAKQLEVAKVYYDGDKVDGYNGNVQRVTYLPLLRDGLAYNHSERTPHHLTVAFMMSLLPMLGQTKPPPPPVRSRPIFQTYKLKIPA